MRKTLAACLCLVFILVGCSSSAPQEGNPSSVQALVAKIQPNMPTSELARLFGSEGQMGDWSGQMGYFEYALPSGQKISVACFSKDGDKNSYVHPDLCVYLQEKPGQQMKRIR